MKKQLLSVILISAAMIVKFTACQSTGDSTKATTEVTDENVHKGGQETVKDDVSQKDVVKIALSSPDHTTLVKALEAGDLVTSLSNAGPFTVFAPTNAAFDQLPAGTLDDLLKPEKKSDLRNILQYHVTVSVFEQEALTDGRTLGMVNGKNAKITVKDGKITINDANIIASVRGSNGIVHVIDKVLLPK